MNQWQAQNVKIAKRWVDHFEKRINFRFTKVFPQM